MRKILLSLMVCLLAWSGYAAGYDTLYVKGGDPIFFPTGMNASEHAKVNWFIGDPEGRLGLGTVGDSDRPIVAKLIKESDDFFKFVQTDAGMNLSYVAKTDAELGNKDKERLDYYIFSIPAREDIEEANLTEAYFRGITCDTLVYIHRYNTLKLSDVLIEYPQTTIVNAGDKVTVKVTYTGHSVLDAEDVILCRYKDGDWGKILVHDGKVDASGVASLSFIAEESTELVVIIMNESGDLILCDGENQIGKINVIPEFEILSLEYERVADDKRYSEKVFDNNKMEVSGVISGEVLNLIIKTNVGEINSVLEADNKTFDLSYAWNKEGLGLPENIGVMVSEKSGEMILTFNKYAASSHDGTYNCIISLEDKVLETVTFKIESALATDNTIIHEEEPALYVVGNLLSIKNINGLVRVYNINGKLVQTIKATGGASMITLNHPQGIYVITCDTHTVKAVVR